MSRLELNRFFLRKFFIWFLIQNSLKENENSKKCIVLDDVYFFSHIVCPLSLKKKSSRCCNIIKFLFIQCSNVILEMIQSMEVVHWEVLRSQNFLCITPWISATNSLHFMLLQRWLYFSLQPSSSNLLGGIWGRSATLW